ncbi:Serine/threonine protein kinase [Nannocystis exedens]|uniref:Serine/threonine protein kinase n=1 Tax=Nannocystis exedens TaxID=54 RepID=A0A1I2A921_9BACT|nr:serine/threonine-protein kinase [Nannocystis exedens]PCC69716.1 Serine/threonine-protein kinase Pkn1 [Nannocystis exedens]SFE40564.1 Serine/threonine protein kinase [Nannocystis exedens]
MAPLLEQAGDVAAWKPRSALLGVLLANRYRITQSIGQGSTGAVYRADDLLMNRPVAVRILVPSLAQNPALVSRIRARIDRNVKIQQQQPDALVNLVDAFDVGMTLEGELFIVTDFLDGDHLSAMLERGGRLPWSRARHLFIRLSQLLQALHERGIVLGTLQAQHCYAVRNRPKNEAIKIVSTAVFEHIAANLGPGAGEVGAQMARYAAPEQGCGEPIDIRTDVYSLGIIAYELLTGKLPFNDTNPIRLVAQHLHAAPTPLRQAAPDAEIPAAVEEVVLKALAKSPADRHPSMEAFAAALSAIPADEPGTPVATVAATTAAAAPAEPAPAPSPPPPPPAPAKPLASSLPVSSDNLSAPVPPVSSAAAAGAVVEESPPRPNAAPAKIAPSVVMRGLIDAPATPPAPPPAPPTSIAPPPPVGPRRPPSIAVPTLIPSPRRPSEPVAAAPVSPAMSEGTAEKAAAAETPPPPPAPPASAPEPVAAEPPPPAAAPAAAEQAAVAAVAAAPAAAPVAAASVAAASVAAASGAAEPVAPAPAAPAPVAPAPAVAASPPPPAAAPVTPAPVAPAPVAPAPVAPAPVAPAPVAPAPLAAAPVTPAPVAAEPPPPPAPAPEPAPAVVAAAPPPPAPSDRPAEAPRPAEIVRMPAPGDSARAAASESMRAPVPADSLRAPAPADSARAAAPADSARARAPAAEIVAVPSALSSQPEEIQPTASVSARRVAAADVHPEALRAAALRQSQSGERLTSSAELRPTESIIAELPKRKTPWVAIVGLGAALAAGAAAYIQTEPEIAPQGNRSVTPPPAKVEPKPAPQVKAEPPPTPTKVEPPPPDPVPIVAPPPDPEPPPPDVEAEEPKKKKKKRTKAAEPEEEEEDLFDQVRKHMEAKKAQEEAYKKAAEAGTSLPGPAPTPAATSPTPAPAPKPAAEDNATKAKDALERARQAAQQGNHPLAYSLAKQANTLARTQEAIELMGVSACKAGNADNAKSAADQLTGARRSAVYSACAGNGITL